MKSTRRNIVSVFFLILLTPGLSAQINEEMLSRLDAHLTSIELEAQFGRELRGWLLIGIGGLIGGRRPLFHVSLFHR